jgi:hypothetical protein
MLCLNERLKGKVIHVRGAKSNRGIKGTAPLIANLGTGWKLKVGTHLLLYRVPLTPYRDSVDGTRDHVTYQKLVTR